MVRFCQNSKRKAQVIQTQTPGNAAGRNSAIEISNSDLLIFIDGDCYASPDLTSCWVDIFKENPTLGFASGRIRKYDLNQSDIGCVEGEDTLTIPPGGFVPRGFIQGSNMAFRRLCLNAAGRFDVRFGAGTPFAGEEWDLAWRASRAGWSGGYYPQPMVWHDHRRFGPEERSRMLYYDYGGGAVYAKMALLGAPLRSLKELARELRGIKDGERRSYFLKGVLAYFSGR